MKIKSETPDQISLYDRSYGPIFGPILSIVGVGVLFVRSNTGAPAWVFPLIGGLMILVGLGALLFSSSYTVDITKTEIHYTRKSLLGAKVDQSYNPADVTQVVVQESISQSYNNAGNNNNGISMGGGTQTNISFQTFLLFKNGLQLPIDNGTSGSSGFSVNGIGLATGSREISMAQKVATFLGVPMMGGQPGMQNMPNMQL